MTPGEYTPLLRSGSSRSSAAQHHIPIQSHYYDITDIESWPIAGLLVMLDGLGQPVRAELHLYDELEPHVQEAAIRQARLVLQEHYLGGAPVPVRILETFQVREEMIVRLPPLGARPTHMARMPAQWRGYGRKYGMIAGAVLGLVLVVWLVSALLGNGREGQGTDDLTVAPQATAEVEAQATALEGTGGVQTVAEAVATSAPASGDLPVSRNARGDLRIGMQIQPVPGLRVALRSEPGLDTGTTTGEFADGDTATIIGGPEYRQGDTDTIVWWFIELSNGVQAWAAANTSDSTLLMPVP